jgi:imidazolonepropionase-like amidohydrolase
MLPGLVDVHAHLALHSPAGDQAPSTERARASARAHLDAGVLAVREPGSLDYSSRDLGTDAGLPRIITAGRFLAPPGRYFPGLAREVTDEALPDAALEELAASGAWVKVIGDSPLPGPDLTATFRTDAVAETVRRVHEAGGKVAIHCAIPQVIQAALDAGVDSLEHASFLQADQVPALAASRTAWVPTRSINSVFRQVLPPATGALFDRQAEVLCAAADAGVTVLAGTDAGVGPHGMVREEIRLLREAGLSSGTALGAGSWTARRWLGLPGLEPAAPADLVAYREDPRERPDILAQPAVVILHGVLARG